MAECSACPTEVKVRLEELKVTRNRQKSQLKPGYHKIFIDRVWERLHGCTDSDGDEADTESDRAQNALLQLSVPPNVKSVSTALVHDSDKTMTSDLTWYTLLQVEPYQTLEQGTLSNKDEDSSREIGFPGLVCRHCMKIPDGRKFFTNSADHLGDLLVTISNHMCSCDECPSTIKSQIASYMTTHENQVQKLKEEHDACMNHVWKRMIEASKSPLSKTAPKAVPIQYRNVDPTMSIVTPNDARLVTDFTLFTMQQVRPCNLDNSGNGSRGCFDFGFPGLECIHCAGQPNSRRFFYRTSEILAGEQNHGILKMPPLVFSASNFSLLTHFRQLCSHP
jgi:hypothetical protein